MVKNYVVTGGFGALGGAVREVLEEDGHRVAVVDLAPVPRGYAGIAEGGVDLAEELGVALALARLAEQLGGLDGLVNVAGGFVWETISDGDLATWDRMYRMNVRTAATASRAAMSHLPSGSAIVNVGAAAAANAAAGMAPYAASKAGVLALTQGLASELKGKGIRVNAVLPTILDTSANRADMPDADPDDWVRPKDAARVIAFLLSDASSCITGEGIRLSGRR